MPKTKHVYQFKITLEDISPEIWRRILVPPDYTFWDLHVAIQDAMGWHDSHLHVFRIRRKHARNFVEIGIPYEDSYEEDTILPGWQVEILTFFNDLGIAAEYEYDFGDSWKHLVLLEGYMVREKGVKYPCCIGGERACPPEDCGGVSGYYHLLEIMSDPTHEEYEEMIEWLGRKYDPEDFNPQRVRFDNPKRRWEIAFLEH